MSLKGTPSILRLVNLGKVERFILDNRVATRPQIAAGTNISLVTVNKLVNALLKEGKIIPSGIDKSTGGRRAQHYRINPDAHYAVGLFYMKGTFIGVVADATGEIVFKRKFPADSKDSESLLQQTFDVIDTLMQAYRGLKAVAIAVGIPGIEINGVLSNIPSLPAWDGFPLASELEARYGIPVLMENDINLAVMGLYASECKDNVSDLMLMYLDEGVGAGIIINGSLFRGKTNFAGELSYLLIDMPGVCGQSGFQEKERLEVAIGKIRQRMEMGEDETKVESALCDVLVQAVTSVISVLNPEVLAIKSSLIHKQVLIKIQEFVSNSIGKSNMPEIILLSDIESYGLDGIVKMCMDHANTSMRIQGKRDDM